MLFRSVLLGERNEKERSAGSYNKSCPTHQVPADAAVSDHRHRAVHPPRSSGYDPRQRLPDNVDFRELFAARYAAGRVGLDAEAHGDDADGF